MRRLTLCLDSRQLLPSRGRAQSSLFASVRVLAPSFVIGAVALGVFATKAQASDARNLVLAIPAGLSDSSFLFAYPSTAAGLSLVAAELGTPAANAYGGALYTWNASTFGLFVSRDASLMQSRGTAVSNSPDIVDSFVGPYQLSRNYLSSPAVGPDPARPLDLIYAYSLGGRRSFGARLTWASDHNKVKTEAQTQENSSNQLDLQIGYTGKAGSTVYDLGLRVGLLGTVENSVKQNDQTNRSTYSRGLSLEFNGRAVIPLSQRLDAYAKAGLFYESPEVEARAAGVTVDEDLKEMLVDLQGGALIKPEAGTIVAVGGSFFYFNSDGPFSLGAAENSTVLANLQVGSEALTLQFQQGKSKKVGYGLLATAGIETNLTESWAFLAGIGYPIFGSMTAKDKVAEGNPEYEVRFADVPDATLWQLGSGYRHGNLKVDAGLNAKSLLHTGPQFITGNASANPLIFIISAVYDFSSSTANSTLEPGGALESPESEVPPSSQLRPSRRKG
jgi:hypothetical protein